MKRCSNQPRDAACHLPYVNNVNALEIRFKIQAAPNDTQLCLYATPSHRQSTTLPVDPPSPLLLFKSPISKSQVEYGDGSEDRRDRWAAAGEEEKGVELREFHIRSLLSPHGGKDLGVTLCLDISIKGRHKRKSAKLG